MNGPQCACCWQVGRADVGEVAFLRRVDVRGLDLDAIVAIEKGKILLYPATLVGSDPGSGGAPGSTRDAPAAQSQRRRKASTTAMTPASAAVLELPGTVAAALLKPPPGEGLNVPAMLTFRRMLVKQRDDAGAVARCGTVTPVLCLCIAVALGSMMHGTVSWFKMNFPLLLLSDTAVCQAQQSSTQQLSVCGLL